MKKAPQQKILATYIDGHSRVVKFSEFVKTMNEFCKTEDEITTNLNTLNKDGFLKFGDTLFELVFILSRPAYVQMNAAQQTLKSLQK